MYHPQTNGQEEQHNATTVLQLRHYVAGHQQDWHSYVILLTYAYNVQIDCYTTLIPFSLVLDWQQSGLTSPTTTMMPLDANNIDSQLSMQVRLINLAALLRPLAKKHLMVLQERYEFDNDKKVCFEPTFVSGNYLFLDKPPVKLLLQSAWPRRFIQNACHKDIACAACWAYATNTWR